MPKQSRNQSDVPPSPGGEGWGEGGPQLCVGIPHPEEPHLAKYIIVERDGRQYPVLFPRAMQHAEMLSPKAGKPISAGFYQIIDADLLLAGGQSTTLKLSARIEDADLIKQLLTK